VDLALCHGHLSVALLLLRHGLRPQNAERARADLRLHGGLRHRAAAEILALLPPAPAGAALPPAAWGGTGLGLEEDDNTPAYCAATGDTFVGVFDSSAAAVAPVEMSARATACGTSASIADYAEAAGAAEELALVPLLDSVA